MKLFALNAGSSAGHINLHRGCFLLLTTAFPVGFRMYQTASPLLECITYGGITVNQTTKITILVGQLIPAIVLMAYVVLYTPQLEAQLWQSVMGSSAGGDGDDVAEGQSTVPSHGSNSVFVRSLNRWINVALWCLLFIFIVCSASFCLTIHRVLAVVDHDPFRRDFIMVVLLKGTITISVSLAVSMMLVQLLVLQICSDCALDTLEGVETKVVGTEVVNELSGMTFFRHLPPDRLGSLIFQGMVHMKVFVGISH